MCGSTAISDLPQGKCRVFGVSKFNDFGDFSCGGCSLFFPCPRRVPGFLFFGQRAGGNSGECRLTRLTTPKEAIVKEITFAVPAGGRSTSVSDSGVRRQS